MTKQYKLPAFFWNSIHDYTTPDKVQLYIDLLKSSDAFMHNSMTKE